MHPFTLGMTIAQAQDAIMDMSMHNAAPADPGRLSSWREGALRHLLTSVGA